MPAVRYYAAARAAAGVNDEQVSGSSLSEVAAEMVQRHGGDLARVLAGCSFLVDGVVARSPEEPVALTEDSTVDVLPPFAGG